MMETNSLINVKIFNIRKEPRSKFKSNYGCYVDLYTDQKYSKTTILAPDVPLIHIEDEVDFEGLCLRSPVWGICIGLERNPDCQLGQFSKKSTVKGPLYGVITEEALKNGWYNTPAWLPLIYRNSSHAMDCPKLCISFTKVITNDEGIITNTTMNILGAERINQNHCPKDYVITVCVYSGGRKEIYLSKGLESTFDLVFDRKVGDGDGGDSDDSDFFSIFIAVWNAKTRLPIGIMGIDNGEILNSIGGSSWRSTLPLPVFYMNSTKNYTKKHMKYDIEGAILLSFRKIMNNIVPSKTLDSSFSQSTVENIHNFIDYYMRKKKHVFVYNKKIIPGVICGRCGLNLFNRSGAFCTSCNLSFHTRCSRRSYYPCGKITVVETRVKVDQISLVNSTVYKPFLSCIQENDFLLSYILGKYSLDRTRTASLYLRFQKYNNCVVKFIKEMLLKDIQVMKKGEALFRSNTMATKILELYMKLTGEENLRETIGSYINEIVTSKLVWEIDDTNKNISAAKLAANISAITGCTSAIMKSMMKTSNTMPLSWKYLFTFIRQEVTKKYPDDQDIGYTSVTAFLFLRFYACAILNPQKFGLISHNPDPEISRTLTLISKTIMCIANMVIPTAKEKYMTLLAPFVTSSLPKMVEYINNVTSVDLGKIREEDISDDIDFPIMDSFEVHVLYYSIFFSYAEVADQIVINLPKKEGKNDPTIENFLRYSCAIVVATVIADKDLENQIDKTSYKKKVYADIIKLTSQTLDDRSTNFLPQKENTPGSDIEDLSHLHLQSDSEFCYLSEALNTTGSTCLSSLLYPQIDHLALNTTIEVSIKKSHVRTAVRLLRNYLPADVMDSYVDKITNVLSRMPLQLKISKPFDK